MRGSKALKFWTHAQKFMLFNIVQEIYRSVNRVLCNQLWCNVWHMCDMCEQNYNNIFKKSLLRLDTVFRVQIWLVKPPRNGLQAQEKKIP